MKTLAMVLVFSGMAMAAHTVDLAWTDTDTGVTFNIYRGSGACSTSPAFTVVNTAPIVPLAFTDTGLNVGKYCYYATAVDTASGLESLPSNLLDVKVLPHSPGGLTATQVN
jgi:hypothetical protein